MTRKQAIVDNAMQWLSRTIAIVLVMIGPVMAGRWLDRRLGTEFLTPVGFVLGTIVATGLLLILARALTPPARGDPIPFDDEETDDGWDEDEDREA